jgi:hypothetical protein
MWSGLAQAMAAQANREIREYNATHPPRYYVVVKPVMGRRTRYYDHHEWEWRAGDYVQVPQYKSRPDPSLLMRDREWAERIALEIGGQVVDTLATDP